MPRYGRDFEPRRMGVHDFSEERGYVGDYRSRRGGRRGTYVDSSVQTGFGQIGGMRSDASRTRYDRFPGEEGWFGEGYAGYPGGDPRSQPGGYERGYEPPRQAGPEGRGAFGPGIRPELEHRGGGRGRPAMMRGGGQPFDVVGDADRIRVRQIMTDDPECVTPGTSVADVAKKMRELDVGIIPVIESEENRRLRGVITDRDLAIRVLATGKNGKAKVADHMTEQVRTVNKNAPIREVFEVMKREQVRRVPVTDRDGRLVGIVAQADLAVDYAGLDLQRETEVEEVIERISEPARPRNR